MRQRKYNYLAIIQGNYGYGWCDLVYYDRSEPDYSRELKTDLKAYRENQPGRYRVIHRRELKEEYSEE